eukprot:12222799-Alexandrium_andersonii.AAC.1
MHEECSRGFRSDLSAQTFHETSGLALGSGALTGDDATWSQNVGKLLTNTLEGRATELDDAGAASAGASASTAAAPTSASGSPSLLAGVAAAAAA